MVAYRAFSREIDHEDGELTPVAVPYADPRCKSLQKAFLGIRGGSQAG